MFSILAWTPFYYLLINLKCLIFYYQFIKNIIFYNIIVLHYFTLTPTFLSYFVFLFLYIVLLLYNNHPFKNNISQSLKKKKKNIQKLKISLDLFWIWKSKPKRSDCQTIVLFTRNERQWRKVEFVHYFRGAFTRTAVRGGSPYDAHGSTDEHVSSRAFACMEGLVAPTLFFPRTHECGLCIWERWNKTRAWSRDMLFRHERAR